MRNGIEPIDEMPGWILTTDDLERWFDSLPDPAFDAGCVAAATLLASDMDVIRLRDVARLLTIIRRRYRRMARRHFRGVANPASKLTEEQAMRALGLVRAGWSCQRVADLLSVHKQTIVKLANGSTWQHLPRRNMT